MTRVIAKYFPHCLINIEGDLDSVSAYGAYDTNKVYEAIRECKAKALIPPRKGVRIWKHANTKGERLNRDENLRAVRKKHEGLEKKSGYHQRSLAGDSCNNAILLCLIKQAIFLVN